MPSETATLDANLAALRRTEPGLADRMARTAPLPLAWSASRSGPLSATIDVGGRPLPLASRFDPVDEATRLLDRVNLARHAAIVALGMGLGHHVALLASRIDDSNLLIVYEPDAGLLRAVFERVDHTGWLGRPNVILVDDRIDRAGLLARSERFAALLTQGTILVTHPPSRHRAGPALQAFGRLVGDVLAYCRTNVATTLVNASRTVSNLSMNLPYYVGGSLTDELYGAAGGYPAICVGAGPSLARNVDQLADASVRERVVVVSAQTTLRPLLERGIRPDFVTALDYSPISARFYEGLPPLPDVTLVAEPLVHPTVLDAFPGPKRVTPNRILERIAGDLARPAIAIRGGATVAHLSFYLAQHLGCDPIILIGQDLGFSDGLYYCPGTAIHDVWLPELGPFNTLEMMEWQRIVRHRAHLKQVKDLHGRPMHSDEQMLTYLKQFERDFAAASQRVLDATEGGMPKQHTEAVRLADALRAHATRKVPPLPMPDIELQPRRLEAVTKLLDRRIEEVAELRRLSRRTLPLLRKMIEHQRDRERMRRLFDRLEPIRRQVTEQEEIFQIIGELNTIGVFKRARADRAIDHAGADPLAEQRLRLERDITNVDWIVQACDEATRIFREARQRVAAERRARRRARAPAA